MIITELHTLPGTYQVWMISDRIAYDVEEKDLFQFSRIMAATLPQKNKDVRGPAWLISQLSAVGAL